jgi:hypothetical protein
MEGLDSGAHIVDAQSAIQSRIELEASAPGSTHMLSSLTSLLRIGSLAVLLALPLHAFDKEVGNFHTELGRNFMELFDTSNLLPLGLGAAAVAGTAGGDRSVRDYFGQARRMKELGNIGDVLGGPVVVSSAVGTLFLAGRFTEDGRFRSMTYSLAQATSLNAGMALGVKAMVRRERPDGENDHSFYSAHSANAFAAAAVVGDYYGTKAAIIAYSTATLIAVSRLEKNKHHLTDTVAGATAGFIIGRTVLRRDRLGRRVPAAHVAPGPQGGLVFTVAFGRH